MLLKERKEKKKKPAGVLWWDSEYCSFVVQKAKSDWCMMLSVYFNSQINLEGARTPQQLGSFCSSDYLGRVCTLRPSTVAHKVLPMRTFWKLLEGWRGGLGAEPL